MRNYSININKKNLFFTIILLTIFATGSILALHAAKKITIIQPKNLTTPDFFITNAAYTQFDQQGNIGNQFYTSKIIHFPEKNNYVFTNPRIIIHNPGEQPWEITANNGKSEWSKSKIYLWGNVKVIQAASSNNPNLDITTKALYVYPDKSFAETNEPVTIIQGGSIAEAIGATADFKTGVINLLSNVKGRYRAK